MSHTRSDSGEASKVKITLTDALSVVSSQFAEWQLGSGLIVQGSLGDAKMGLGNLSQKAARNDGEIEKKEIAPAAAKLPVASISAGTEDRHRASIDDARWRVLERLAVRSNKRPADVLRELIDRAVSGKRGRGQREETLHALEILLKHVTLDFVRYEGALRAFLERTYTPSEGNTLVAAEAEDHHTALALVVLHANGALLDLVANIRSVVSELRT